MRTLHLGIFAFLCLSAALFPAHADELWRIGEFNADFDDLAIAGAHQRFAESFAEGVDYTVGKSAPKRDWPYIHPGPADSWAGGRAHDFNIQFNMRRIPKTGCRLLLVLRATHNYAPPAVSVAVNGNACPVAQLPAGSSDEALTQARAGKACRQSFIFPSNWLSSGKNEIVITTVSGSWMIYDAVKLESGVSNEPDIARVEALCTPFFKTVDGALRQAVRVRVENDGLAGPGALALNGADGIMQEVDLPAGNSMLTLLVPPFVEEQNRQITLKAGGKEISAEFQARPERQWTLFVAPSAHTDIGYTDLQEKCIALHVDNTIAGLNAAGANPDFKWNLEVFAHYDWFKELKPELMETLNQSIQNRQTGLTALYLNMLTGLCNGPEMMRLLAPAQQCARDLGVPVVMASLNDVPSSVGTLPMFLRHAGVRYFAEAINEDRGPVFMHCDPEMNQSPFWWEAPDGSRVLTMFTRTYFQVWQIRLHESVAAVEEALPKFLDRFLRKNYPGDAVFINGAFLDNCAMTPNYANVIAEWNAAWDYPKFIMTTPDEYFSHVETHFGNELPVYRGDMGVFWEDGAASSAAETGMVRRAKNILGAAEKWSALAAARNDAAPSAAASDVWKNILYYDEHTWGSAISISDPNNPQSTGQWTRKAAFADNSLEQSRTAQQEQGLTALAQLAGAEPDANGRFITVSNSLAWERDICIVLDAEDNKKGVRDKHSGKHMHAQRTSDNKLCFIAENVPAMGWRVFELTTASKANGQPLLRDTGTPNTWMTDRFSFHINPATGGLDQITDLVSGQPWVDADSGYHMNQFLHVAGGNGTAMIHPNHKPVQDLAMSTHDTASVNVLENGPARAVLHIQRTGGPSPVDTELVIHRNGTLDFINVIRKTETLEKEAGYFAFPFALNTPDRTTAYVELPYGIIAADQEQMPGACREWYAVNTFAAVDNGARSACVAACDTPLFTIGDINRGQWPNRLVGNRHILFAYVYNNYWHTNYKASQGGDIRCAFSIQLADAPYNPTAATKFGWAGALDLTPDLVAAFRAKRVHGPSHQSLASLDSSAVLLAELLQLDPERTLARLYNPAAAPAQTALSLQDVAVKNILTTDLFGENGSPVCQQTKISVPARGIATIVLQTK